MTDLNHVVLIGRLTRDAALRYLENGTACANVSLAVNKSRKQADGQWVEETSYFDVVIWGRLAESLNPKMTKGKQLCVEGRLKQDRWEKDGQTHSKVSIVADFAQVLSGANGGQAQQAVAPAFKPKSSAPQQEYESPAEDSDFPEDIPF